ncbi:MAG: lipoyl synthase [Syntrophorhabdales bacterium]|jgi:lipoic acid synthetase
MMRARLPEWFRQRIPEPGIMQAMVRLLREKHLHTVCEGAICPNIGGCFARNTATFMILGDTCTRRCAFCAVKKGVPLPVDEKEPYHIVEAIQALGLVYAVITSVTRDDLDDGGASHFASVIRAIREYDVSIRVEVLVPDFGGSEKAVRRVAEARPHVINHNIETVQRLYPRVRPEADFGRSIELLSRVKSLDEAIVTKSGLMLGLGEEKDEVLESMKSLRGSGCDLLTLGQYLQPSVYHYPVVRFVPPDEFADYEGAAEGIGFAGIASAPLVRSSFRAAELYGKAEKSKQPSTLALTEPG